MSVSRENSLSPPKFCWVIVFYMGLLKKCFFVCAFCKVIGFIHFMCVVVGKEPYIFWEISFQVIFPSPFSDLKWHADSKLWWPFRKKLLYSKNRLLQLLKTSKCSNFAGFFPPVLFITKKKTCYARPQVITF